MDKNPYVVAMSQIDEEIQAATDSFERGRITEAEWRAKAAALSVLASTLCAWSHQG